MSKTTVSTALDPQLTEVLITLNRTTIIRNTKAVSFKIISVCFQTQRITIKTTSREEIKPAC